MEHKGLGKNFGLVMIGTKELRVIGLRQLERHKTEDGLDGLFFGEVQL